MRLEAQASAAPSPVPDLDPRYAVCGTHLLVTSQRTRDQLRNLEDARDKVKNLVERAMKAPRPRRITQPRRVRGLGCLGHSSGRFADDLDVPDDGILRAATREEHSPFVPFYLPRLAGRTVVAAGASPRAPAFR
jgi:hypothetical protein